MPLTPNTRAVLTHFLPRSVDAPDEPRAMAASAPPVPVRGPHNDRQDVPGVQRGVARVFSLFRLSVAPASKSSAPLRFRTSLFCPPHRPCTARRSIYGWSSQRCAPPPCVGWAGQGGGDEGSVWLFFRVPVFVRCLACETTRAHLHSPAFFPSCTPWLPFMTFRTMFATVRCCSRWLFGVPPRRFSLDWVLVA